MEEDNQNNIQNFTPEDSITNTPIEPEQPLTPKPRKKLSKTTIIATLAIILGLAGIGFGVYSLVNSKNTPNAPAIENKEEMAESEKQNLNLPYLAIKNENCLGEGCEREFSAEGFGGISCNIYATLNNNDNLEISVGYDHADAECYPGEKTGEQSFIVDNFESKISSVLVSDLGNAAFYDTAFILMEDGSVEYIPLIHAVRSNTVRSYGKIADVEKVVRLLPGSTCGKDTEGMDCGITVLAQREDGKFYDIGHAVQLDRAYSNL